MTDHLRGTIDKLKSGRFRVRIWEHGKRKTIAVVDTRGEAVRLLAALREEYTLPSGHTIASLGEQVLKYREDVRKMPSACSDRSAFEKYVCDADWARQPIEAVSRRDIRLHLEAKQQIISPSVLGRALRILRLAYEDACEKEIISASPVARGSFSLRKIHSSEAASQDTWTVLSREEQLRLLACEQVPMHRRIAYAVALYTGARLGEIRAMQWVDLSLQSSNPKWKLCRAENGAPKNGRIRRIEMLRISPVIGVPQQFSDAVSALLWWRQQGDNTKLVFPSPKGGMYCKGYDFVFSDHPSKHGTRVGAKSLALGSEHPATFHSLRHTCASSLLSGAWGHAWTREEIQAWMGWRSPKMVDRYAHLTESNLAQTIAKTGGALPTFCPRPNSRPLPS